MEKKRLDLIFCQVNKHKPNMAFENFLSCLPKIAEFKFTDKSRIDALHLLIHDYLLPLSESVTAQRAFTSKELNTDLEFDELVSMLLKNVGSVLLEIY